MNLKHFSASFVIFAMAFGLTANANSKELTRAEVKAELAELRALGYSFANDDPHYPRHIQEVMKKLHEARAAANSTGISEPEPSHKQPEPAVEADHHPDKCVGPVSFCNTYFGS
ncbi:DUF4148 domain-containing protein [Burkholderia dolosa]|uniref:DUF4148 domain-containing protein n=1 Tax=Burkholderia dolosa TaxID=152500 RepID=A0A892IEN6_9BURK|nr:MULTISPECIES: DUF4148 domain-containing protein [Burkholderia]AJY09646.1 hypothetical protein AK34_4658 [Burkholderia dolosa AU0158]MBR8313200.1 DUF4148 domain-containing protein [Burkholderia dolosa]MBR8420218.1 DUF4148 domain-containing protein [Burkholderia dolosa]MBY4658370.1 DUF4148 domain-containing protein [Burkholderia dolosa]MBY4690440.1 DUF4148 domain-containing protein [Burkholderia dolosa]